MGKKVIVVGAGPGGLATALRLVGQEYDVEVFEAQPRVGGRMRGFERDGYAFDTGPSILQMPQLFDDLFASAGLRREEYVSWTRLDTYTKLRFWDDSQLELTTDQARLNAQLADFRSDLPDCMARWKAEQKRLNAAGYEPYLSQPVRPLLGYVNLKELTTVLSFRPWESLYQHFWRHFKDDRLVYSLSYPAKYLGMHPTLSSSVFSLIPYLEMRYGVWHPQGGFRALAKAIAKAIQDLSGQIHLNAPVQEIIVRGGQAVGVLLQSGERVMGDAVVVNADFAQAVQTLVPEKSRGKYTEAYFEKKQFSCSTFMLYLGLDCCYKSLPHHQIYLSEHVKRRDRPFVNDSALDEVNPPFYVCNPTPTDASNAPTGHSTLYVLVPIPNTGYDVDWQAKKKSYRDFIIRQLPLLGFEGIEKHIISETCYTANTWEHDFSVYRGAVFNLSHTLPQLGPFRPPIRSKSVERLYWTGGAVHPGSGLMTILESSKNAALFVQRALSR